MPPQTVNGKLWFLRFSYTSRLPQSSAAFFPFANSGERRESLREKALGYPSLVNDDTPSIVLILAYSETH